MPKTLDGYDHLFKGFRNFTELILYGVMAKTLPKRITQVWSLTQFYSVGFSPSRNVVKRAFSTNAQSRFASAVLDGVLGHPRLAQHT